MDAEHEISDNIILSYGIRYSSFLRLGQNEMNIYENNQAVVFNEELQIYEKGKPIGTNSYDRSDVIKSFGNFEH